MINTRTVWWRPTLRRCLWACAYRRLALTLINEAYLALLIATFIAVRLVEHAPIHLYWTIQDAALFLAEAALATAVGFLITLGTVMRWRPPAANPARRRRHQDVDGRAARRQLDVKPLLVRGAYVPAAALEVLSAQQTGDVFVAFCFVGPLVLIPIVAWTALWVSRRHPQAGWAKTATWPIWSLVELWMLSSRVQAERDRDRRKQEAFTGGVSNGIPRHFQSPETGQVAP